MWLEGGVLDSKVHQYMHSKYAIFSPKKMGGKHSDHNSAPKTLIDEDLLRF
jgi:hypothetical protein